MGPFLPGDLQHIPEATGRYERCLRPLSLEDGICCDRRPLNQVGNRMGGYLIVSQETPHRLDNAFGRVLRRARYLGDPMLTLLIIHGIKICKGSSNVNRDSHSHDFFNLSLL
jgi:hypothetical protein